MSIIDVGMRLGDAIDPFQLANGFEAVIGYECQERSNPPFSHSYGLGRQGSVWGAEAQRKCVRCMQGVCCGFCCWQGLANRSMRIQDVYVGAVPIPLCIKKKSILCVVSLPMNDEVRARAHAHAYPHTPTCIGPRTHIGSS
jgi:hypothetical protein